MDHKAALLDDSKKPKVSNCLDNDALYSIVGPLIKEGQQRHVVGSFQSIKKSIFLIFHCSSHHSREMEKLGLKMQDRTLKVYRQAELRHYYENFMQSARSFQGMLLLCMS